MSEKPMNDLEKEKLLLEIRRLKRPHWLDGISRLSSFLALLIAILSVVYTWKSGILEDLDREIKLENKENSIKKISLLFDNKKLDERKLILNKEIETFQTEKSNLILSKRKLKKTNTKLSREKENLYLDILNLNKEKEQLITQTLNYRDSLELEKLRQFNLAILTQETKLLWDYKINNYTTTYTDYIQIENKVQKFLTNIIDANISKINQLEKDNLFTIIYSNPGERNGRYGENYSFFIRNLISGKLTGIKQDIYIEIIDEFLKNLSYIFDLDENRNNITLNILTCMNRLPPKNDVDIFSKYFHDLKEVELYKNDSVYNTLPLKSLNNVEKLSFVNSLFIKDQFIKKGYSSKNIRLVGNNYNSEKLCLSNNSIYVSIEIKNLFLKDYKNLEQEDKNKVIEKYRPAHNKAS